MFVRCKGYDKGVLMFSSSKDQATQDETKKIIEKLIDFLEQSDGGAVTPPPPNNDGNSGGGADGHWIFKFPSGLEFKIGVFELYNDEISAEDLLKKSESKTILETLESKVSPPEHKQPAHTNQLSFDSFKTKYYAKYNSQFFKNPFSVMKGKLENNSIKNIGQVNTYAIQHPNSRTAKILKMSK